MTVLLLMVVFTGLGLAMLHASGVHVKINGFRKFSALLDCASENGLKRGLHDLRSWIEAEGLLAAVPAERIEAMRADPRTGFPLLLEERPGVRLPPDSRGVLRRHDLGKPGRLRVRRSRGHGRLSSHHGGPQDRGLGRPSPGSATAASRSSRARWASSPADCPCRPSPYI